MDPDPLPGAVREAVRVLGLAPDQVRPLPGATGQTWAAGPGVLRVRPSGLLRRELTAGAAAGAAVPVPRVLDVVDLGPSGGLSAALLQRLPGRPAGALDGVDPERARRRGRACGRLHDALAAVRAPQGLRRVDGTDRREAADRLLHLDLHALNVLVDDDDNVSGVVDWANAAAGPPELDRARTATMYSWDPAVLAVRSAPAWAALIDGWAEAASFPQIPRHAMLWACRYLLADLEERYDADQLSGLRVAIGELSPE